MATVNHTVIALIPKVAEPVRMKQLRPISLCTTIYKIVSKTLLNRIKPYLHLCISENQSTFLKGRHISDNILFAHKFIHYLSSSKNGPNKGTALKLDMEKAFDRVEWTFLHSVMLRVGFHPDWVALIMECVTTVTFSVRVNGRLTTEFTPQRGLRQGDPLSPFLFLLCMQGLSAALHAVQEAGNIMGIRASQNGPRINHLFYADDSIIFVRNSVQEFIRLKEVLRIFVDSSSQHVNFEKLTVFFSPNTTATHRQRFMSILPFSKVLDPGIYLGAPLKVGKNKINVFNFINETMDKRIDGWTKRLLSFGGSEIFLKSVAQALPQYIMSCYLLPRIITDRITSSMRMYWWTGKANEPGWALMAWDKICMPKNAGGLGLRDLRCFNLALLGKQLWRLLTRPESLVARVMPCITVGLISDFPMWLLALLELYDNRRNEEIFLTIWALWTARNKLIFKGQTQNPNVLSTFVRSYLSELNLLSARLNPQISVINKRWSSPPSSFYKINVDASFHSADSVAGLGVVVRDEEGFILGAFSSLAFHVPSAFAAEALAARCGVQFDLELGLTRVILEGDALSIIKKLQLQVDDLSEVSAFIFDTKRLARQFQAFQIGYIPRSGNKVAHALASERFSLMADHAWIEDAPSHILALVDEDRRCSEPP
ncbi:hypothetical protein GQ457_13G007950 [Hibiscus cannabinus]